MYTAQSHIKARRKGTEVPADSSCGAKAVLLIWGSSKRRFPSAPTLVSSEFWATSLHRSARYGLSLPCFVPIERLPARFADHLRRTMMTVADGAMRCDRRRDACVPTAAAIALMVLLAGCSIKQTAVNVLGDALSDGGGVYASDNDPDLVREAIPFGLKTIEGLLEEAPEHEGLLLSAASGFTGFAFLLRQEADFIEHKDPEESRRLRVRASGLFLRGRNFSLDALDLRHPGFRNQVREDTATALAATTTEDVPFLYWAGAAWAGAVGADERNLNLVAELPIAAAIVGRVLDLDEMFGGGAAHEFFVSYEAGRPGGNLGTARAHYTRALKLSQGRRASIHLTLAEGVVVEEQDADEFRRLLDAARGIDPDTTPDLRLVNTLAHRRAAWLEQHMPELFFNLESREPTS